MSGPGPMHNLKTGKSYEVQTHGCSKSKSSHHKLNGLDIDASVPIPSSFDTVESTRIEPFLGENRVILD